LFNGPTRRTASLGLQTTMSAIHGPHVASKGGNLLQLMWEKRPSGAPRGAEELGSSTGDDCGPGWLGDVGPVGSSGED